MANVTKDLGGATAYAYAVSKGYTGTAEEFAELMADLVNAKDDAEASASDAEAYGAGTRGGTAVTSTDGAYQNNAKYYKEQAQQSAQSISQSAQQIATNTSDIADLKEDINQITSGTSNLFDINKLKANGITVDTETASATGTGTSFVSNFESGIPLDVEFKENTQYTLKAVAKHMGTSVTGNGLRLRFKYTDGTYTLMTFSNTSTTDTEKEITSTQGKTVDNISISVGSATSNIWTVKQIQLNEGTDIKEYMPYSTAEDLIARTDIKTVQKSEENKKITFSVIGDSYSAYPAWIPEGNASYYPTASETVKSVTQMWWYILSKNIKANPITIDGWSGARITTVEGSESNAAFVKRIKKSMGESRATEVKPDIIFVLGGQNDTNAQVTIGQPKYSDWTDEDLTIFAPAFCYMIDYLRMWNPSTRIINLINEGGVSQEMQDAMTNICSHYDIENIILSGIQKASHHPTATGMQTIADIITELI